MKHGRPDKQWYEFCGKKYHMCRSSDGLGWRREHAARVFQAIQAVALVSYWSDFWFRAGQQDGYVDGMIDAEEGRLP